MNESPDKKKTAALEQRLVGLRKPIGADSRSTVKSTKERDRRPTRAPVCWSHPTPDVGKSSLPCRTGAVELPPRTVIG